MYAGILVIHFPVPNNKDGGLEIVLQAIAYGTAGSNRTRGILESYLTILEILKV